MWNKKCRKIQNGYDVRLSFFFLCHLLFLILVVRFSSFVICLSSFDFCHPPFVVCCLPFNVKKQCKTIQNQNRSKVELTFHCLTLAVCCLRFAICCLTWKKNGVKKYKIDASQSWISSFIVWHLTFAIRGVLFGIQCEENNVKKYKTESYRRWTHLPLFCVWLFPFVICCLPFNVKKKKCRKIQNRKLSKLELDFHCLSFDFHRLWFGVRC